MTVPVWGLAVLMLVAFWGFNADDAYIVGRYASNAAAGLGLVYNQGDYVSALTSPLHGLIETAIAALGMPPVGTYRLIAPFLLLVALVKSAKLAGLRQNEIVFFYAFTVTSPYVLIWSVGGLETPILTVWVTLFTALFIKSQRGAMLNDPELLGAGILVGLAFLTRHDSVIVLGPLYLGLLFVHSKRIGAWVGLALSGLLAASWLLFAYLYYGDILPTSAYLKLLGSGRAFPWHFAATLNFLLVSGLVLLAPLALLGALDQGHDRRGRMFIYLAVVCGAAYALKTAGAHMFFSYRAFAPYIPAIGLMLLPVARRYFSGALALTTLANIGGFLAICFVGLTPVVVRHAPFIGHLPVEYTERTQFDYASMQRALRQDALDLRAHWRAQNKKGQPTIFLYTGGMGYWLPEFFVFEALVDYRKNCPHALPEKLSAAHYVQDLSSVHVNAQTLALWHQAHADGATSGPVSTSQVEIDGPATLQYWYADRASTFRFPHKLGGICNL